MIAESQRLAEGVLGGDRRAIARSISRIEADGGAAAEIVKGIFRDTGRAYRLGVTGAPGVGKSTLVDRLTAGARRRGRTVGILAVDPTSPFSGGAVLGDRVRMQVHAADAGVFVRSMATRGALGGLARATSDAALILDAAGFDLIMIETVGVGQAEIEISRTADMTAVVTMPGSGDGVQALKAGVMEIADLFIVNKADHDGADRAVTEIETMLGFNVYAPGDWRPPVLQTRALDGAGVDDVLDALDQFRARGAAAVRRRQRTRVNAWLRRLVADRFLERLEQRVLDAGAFDRLVVRVAAAEVDPYTAAEQLVDGALAARDATLSGAEGRPVQAQERSGS